MDEMHTVETFPRTVDETGQGMIVRPISPYCRLHIVRGYILLDSAPSEVTIAVCPRLAPSLSDGAGTMVNGQTCQQWSCETAFSCDRKTHIWKMFQLSRGSFAIELHNGCLKLKLYSNGFLVLQKMLRGRGRTVGGKHMGKARFYTVWVEDRTLLFSAEKKHCEEKLAIEMASIVAVDNAVVFLSTYLSVHRREDKKWKLPKQCRLQSYNVENASLQPDSDEV